MSDRPAPPTLPLPEDFLHDSSRNGQPMPPSTPAAAEDFSIFMGDPVPLVGRPVAIVTYRRYALSGSDERRESATYGAFFSHEGESFSSALFQRSYLRGAYPRLGALATIERTRDEAVLALESWLTTWRQSGDHDRAEATPLVLRKIDVETLFGLYVFSAGVRACVQESLSALQHTALHDTLSGWGLEVGVNTVPLQPAKT